MTTKMKKNLLLTLLLFCSVNPVLKAQKRLPEYLQAEKFTLEKLNTMLFSTAVDPHWFQKGNSSGMSIRRVKEPSGMWSTRRQGQRNHCSTVTTWLPS